MSSQESIVGGYVASQTIYGTHEDSHVVMSEKVQSLAGSIYNEFERMISIYDRDVVKKLMPLLVNVLECLDSAYKTNQEHDVELELLREDNEQLVTQYEREKTARKLAEKQLFEFEDQYEGERKDLMSRLESLDSIVRMLELKHKNSQDHSSRLEERENDLKKEYAKLHERYTELFKTHMDYMERTKLLLSSPNDRTEVRGRLGLNPMGRSSGPISFGFTSLEGPVHIVEQTESMPGSPVSMSSSPSSTIGSELAAVHTVEKTQQQTSPAAPSTVSKSQTKSEKRSGNTLYQELSFNDTDAAAAEGEEAADLVTASVNGVPQNINNQSPSFVNGKKLNVTDGESIAGSWVHPGEYASSVNDNYFGMGKEVENLILENTELLATKNALNVVKDDLIVKVDELTGEQEILREEISNLSSAREKLRERVSQLEEELRHIKESVSNSAGGGEQEEEADVPMAQRKRFTRVEMARVLMERNQYKERFMELQDAVRYTEIMRASHATIDKKNKQTIWQFFSNLFSTSDRPHRPLSTPHLRAVAAPQPSMRHSRTQADFLGTQLTDHRRHERSEQIRQVRAHVRKEDGRTQAYGWSLPGKNSAAAAAAERGYAAPSSLPSGGVPVPVPIFCRPIAEGEPLMTLVCAAAVNPAGGRTPDGGCMVGSSVFYCKPDDSLNPVSLAQEMFVAQTEHSAEVEQISRQLESTSPVHDTERQLSSLVWICSSTNTKGMVMIIDANNPAEVLETISVGDKHLLCIASVPGAVADDYQEFMERSVDDDKADTEEHKTTGSTKDTEIGFMKRVKVSPVSARSSPVKAPPPAPAPPAPAPPAPAPQETRARDAPTDSPPLNATPPPELETPEAGVDAFAQEQSSKVERSMSTVMATMWLGTKSGNLYIHSAVANHSQCLARVKLNDAILSIASCASRCVVALADGTVAVFARQEDGQWDFSEYWSVVLGDPKCSVRCLSAVGSTVWCGYRNRVHVLEPRARTLLNTFEAHPRHESQLRQMVCDGDGVWVSIKMDSTLRLYHAHTYQHLMDVDIEPYVSKMLGTGKLGFSLVRITALLISSGRLWIGTSNGVVISVPLTDATRFSTDAAATYSTLKNFAGLLNAGSPTSGIPLCNMAHAQLSFHGHRDAVKFFVAVPSAAAASPAARTPTPPLSATFEPEPAAPPMLVISGGEGYIDFRIADSEMEDSVVIAEDGTASCGGGDAERLSKSHLIVWQVARP